MGDAKDLTSTSFGLVIAFLLPGLAGLATLSIWINPISEAFGTFITEEANIGLFFIVTLGALLLGLQISLVRLLVFQVLWSGIDKKFFKSRHLDKWYRRPSLTDDIRARIPTNLIAYRATIDETYRYYQFWGGMAVVIPGATFGLYSTTGPVLTAVFIVIEILTIWGAMQIYKDYVRWATAALGG